MKLKTELLIKKLKIATIHDFFVGKYIFLSERIERNSC